MLGDSGAASRQAHYVAALTEHSQGLVQVTQGRYQAKTMTCRHCRASFTRHEEKETDVNIAVSLVADVAAGALDAALVISADSDLAPAIRVSRGMRSDVFIAAAFPPKRFSNELKTLMPASFHIGHSHIRSNQLPDVVASASGGQWTRPDRWR